MRPPHQRGPSGRTTSSRQDGFDSLGARQGRPDTSGPQGSYKDSTMPRVAGNRLVLLLLTFLACRLFGSSSGTMTRRGLCWKADVTVTVTVTMPQWFRRTWCTRCRASAFGSSWCSGHCPTADTQRASCGSVMPGRAWRSARGRPAENHTRGTCPMRARPCSRRESCGEEKPPEAPWKA
jgi:hypothetical protein